ncbi:hypothetical protein M569_06841 [Genlisea aurea]|uniref:Uncharacterized protein n=1 Tax=Genlisea aurea TaxID=192259 RepID=S8DXC6_9LAMI|nr:hypothetical protein M569_06841 [Genlisea aurea]
MALNRELFCEKHVLYDHGDDIMNDLEPVCSEKIEEADSGGVGASHLQKCEVGFREDVHEQRRLKKRGRPKGSKPNVNMKALSDNGDIKKVLHEENSVVSSILKGVTRKVIVDNGGVAKALQEENDGRVRIRKRGRPKGSSEKEENMVLLDSNGLSRTVHEENNGQISIRKRQKSSTFKAQKKVLFDNNDVTMVLCEENDGGIIIRKRGRPKGSKNKAKNKVLSANIGVTRVPYEENDDGISILKRGQLKGLDTKARMKDLVDNNDSAVVLHEENDAGIIIRKRGRPKGSKNKKKVTSDKATGGIEWELHSQVNGKIEKIDKINGVSVGKDGSFTVILYFY